MNEKREGEKEEKKKFMGNENDFDERESERKIELVKMLDNIPEPNVYIEDDEEDDDDDDDDDEYKRMINDLKNESKYSVDNKNKNKNKCYFKLMISELIVDLENSKNEMSRLKEDVCNEMKNKLINEENKGKKLKRELKETCEVLEFMHCSNVDKTRKVKVNNMLNECVKIDNLKKRLLNENEKFEKDCLNIKDIGNKITLLEGKEIDKLNFQLSKICSFPSTTNVDQEKQISTNLSDEKLVTLDDNFSKNDNEIEIEQKSHEIIDTKTCESNCSNLESFQIKIKELNCKIEKINLDKIEMLKQYENDFDSCKREKDLFLQNVIEELMNKNEILNETLENKTKQNKELLRETNRLNRKLKENDEKFKALQKDLVKEKKIREKLSFDLLSINNFVNKMETESKNKEKINLNNSLKIRNYIDKVRKRNSYNKSKILSLENDIYMLKTNLKKKNVENNSLMNQINVLSDY